MESTSDQEPKAYEDKLEELRRWFEAIGDCVWLQRKKALMVKPVGKGTNLQGQKKVKINA